MHGLLRAIIKIVVASLVVGTILTHFGVTPEKLMTDFGLSAERLQDYAQRGFAWALPNMLMGALVIVPVWFVLFLFRPPGQRKSE